MSHPIFTRYIEEFKKQLDRLPLDQLESWANHFQEAWREGRQVFLCGNGGSAANAIHLANDFLYGIAPGESPAMRVIALPSNPAVLTCLGNDIGYDAIFSQQLETLANPGDLLMVFSGSGNSPNIVQALEAAGKLRMRTFAVLGFSGGQCKGIAQNVIHIPLRDMQISEDLQVVIGHMVMQWLHDQGKGE
jgi:D-sedoheptulose 7-phosphate isomerase